jgi:phage terminase Nu1 subunit (DNA packaging protein)
MKQVPKPQGQKLNRSGVARLFGVSLTAVDNWIVAGLPGQKVDGHWEFDRDEIKAWKAERGNGKPPRGAITLGEARRRKIIADTELSRFELRKLKREYIPNEQVEEVWCRLVGNFKARILTMPSKLAPRLIQIADPNVIRGMLMDAMYEALTELSSEGNIQSVMADLEKHPTGVERGNGVDTEESWPRP